VRQLSQQIVLVSPCTVVLFFGATYLNIPTCNLVSNSSSSVSGDFFFKVAKASEPVHEIYQYRLTIMINLMSKSG